MLAVLRPTPGKRDQFVDLARHLATEFSDQLSTAGDDRLRLVAIESGGADLLLEGREVRVGVVRRPPVFLEQRLRHLVDASIRTLRRQDDRDQQLQGIAELQGDLRVGVALQQPLGDLAGIGRRHALLGLGRRFCAACHRSTCARPLSTADHRSDRPPLPRFRFRAIDPMSSGDHGPLEGRLTTETPR